MSRGTTRPRGRSFEQDLRREVNAVPVGSRIPSIRELRSRYSVGQAAVERAVARLSQQGMIEVRPKSGIYRSATPAGPISVIYRSRDMEFDRSGGYYADFVTHLMAELARAGHVVRFLSTEDDQEFATIVRRINRNHERAVTFALKWSDVDTVTAQAGMGSSFIHVLPNFVETIDNSIILNDRDIVRLQMEHLMERGHRAIAYLHGYVENKWSRAAFQRYNAFRDYVLDHKLELAEAMLRPSGINGVDTHDVILEMHRQGPPPTAIVINSDVCVRDAYRALRTLGREPGKDVAVVSVNNRPWCDFVEPGLTSVDISPRRGAEAVTRVLSKLEVGEPVSNQVLEARLIVRPSSDVHL